MLLGEDASLNAGEIFSIKDFLWSFQFLQWYSSLQYFSLCWLWIYFSQVCKSVLPSLEELKEHLKKHLTTGVFMCDKCSFIAPGRRELTAHVTHTHSFVSFCFPR